ncbi:hypothetical protein MMC11_007325 [Xylographa trunciseda]|nr:hypothetical protein [Xylographa trunciseda]
MAFFYQNSGQHAETAIDDLTALRFSLHRFSCSTTPVGHKAAVWSHSLKKDNHFAVFDHISSKTSGGLGESRTLLRILQGGDTLEVICFKDLLEQVHVDEARATDSQASESSRNIVIIIQKPLVAFRFRLLDGQTRRLQLNFSTEIGYEHTVKKILAASLPVVDKNVQTGTSTSSQPNIVSNRTEVPAPHFSKSLTGAAITQYHKTNTTIDCNLRSALSTGLLTSDHHGVTPKASASNPRFHSSGGLLDTKFDTDRTSRPYQMQTEHTRHPQFSASDPTNQAPIEAEGPEFNPPSTTSVALTDMSFDMLSQILPPKRALPFAIVQAKRPRLEASSSSTIEGSATGPKVIHKANKDLAKSASEPILTQRAKPKSSSLKSARPKASTAKKLTSGKVAVREAKSREATEDQNPPRELASKRVILKMPKPRTVVYPPASTVQNISARVTRSSSQDHVSQEVLFQYMEPLLKENTPHRTKPEVPQPVLKDASTQTDAADTLHFLMPVSGNANPAPCLRQSHIWANEHIREVGYQSFREPASESATVLADRSVAKRDLQVYADRPWEERPAGLSDAMFDAIMEENFVKMCEDVEKALEETLKGC